MSNEKPPKSFTKEEERRRDEQTHIQQTEGRSLGSDHRVKEGSKANKTNEAKNDSTPKEELWSELVNRERAANDPAIIKLKEQKLKQASGELLRKDDNELKSGEQEKEKDKASAAKAKEAKVKEVKASENKAEKKVKIPATRPQFDEQASKKNQNQKAIGQNANKPHEEPKQQSIDAKVNKDEVKPKPSLQSKIQKFFSKAEPKVKEALEVKQTPKSEKTEQPQKTEKKNLAQKLKQDFKPIKKETPVKSKPIKKLPTKGK